MKKLFALAIVASMSFFSCGNSTPEEEVVAEETTVEQTTEQQEQPAAEMPAEETQETAPAAE